jgi:hypothetical protein
MPRVRDLEGMKFFIMPRSLRLCSTE